MLSRLALTLSMVSCVLLIAVAGCSSEEAKVEKHESVFKPYTRAIDKAKNVQKTLDTAAKKHKEQIDAHTH